MPATPEEKEGAVVGCLDGVDVDGRSVGDLVFNVGTAVGWDVGCFVG